MIRISRKKGDNAVLKETKCLEAFGVEVEMYLSPKDNVLVIDIMTEGLEDSEDGEPRCRIYLNDACLHENPKYPGR